MHLGYCSHAQPRVGLYYMVYVFFCIFVCLCMPFVLCIIFCTMHVSWLIICSSSHYLISVISLIVAVIVALKPPTTSLIIVVGPSWFLSIDAFIHTTWAGTITGCVELFLWHVTEYMSQRCDWHNRLWYLYRLWSPKNLKSPKSYIAKPVLLFLLC